MERQRIFWLEKIPRRVRRVRGIHHELAAADRNQDEIGLVVLADHFHIAEQPRVAHVIDLEAVLQLDDKAAGLSAEMDLVFSGGGIVPDQLGIVLGMDHGDLYAVRPEGHDVAALGHAVRELLRNEAKRRERSCQALWRPQGRVVFLCEFGRVAEMIAMGVRDQDEIHLAQRVEVLVLVRRFRILDKIRIDYDHLAARRGELDGGLAEPQDFDFPALRPGLAGEERQHDNDAAKDLFHHHFLLVS